MFFNNASQGSPPPATTDPDIAPDFHNLMKGVWKDGVPLSQGGTGYEVGADPYDFAYDSNPSDADGWNECTANSSPGDRRFLMSFGPFDLNPGDIGKLSFAVVWLPSQTYPCPDVSNLVDAANDMQELYEEHSQDIIFSSTNNFANDRALSISPNPASGEVLFQLIQSGVELENIQLLSTDGKLMKSTGSISGKILNLDLGEFTNGVYLYRALLSDGKLATGRVVIHH